MRAASELDAEVVLDGELEADVVVRSRRRCWCARPTCSFAAHHQVRRPGSTAGSPRRTRPLVVAAGVLEVGVVHFRVAVADRARPLVAPVVVVVGDDARQRHRLGLHVGQDRSPSKSPAARGPCRRRSCSWRCLRRTRPAAGSCPCSNDVDRRAEVDAPAGLAALRPLVARSLSRTRSRPCAGCRRPGSGPSRRLMRHCAVRSGSFLVVLDRRVLEALDQSRMLPASMSLPGSLDGDREVAGVGLERRPADLHVAVEHHARRAPVVDRVREHVAVHEQAVGLAGQQRAPLAVGVAQAERGLARIGAGAEQVELELEVDRACRPRWSASCPSRRSGSA